MADSSKDPESVPISYTFGWAGTGSRNLPDAMRERGPIAPFAALIALAVGGYAVLDWSQQDAYWDPVLVFTLFPVWAVWHFFGEVVEIRLDERGLAFRRLAKFRTIPWREIDHVRAWSARVVSLAYVRIKGRSFRSSAFFPVAIPPDRRERWKQLCQLLDEVAKRVPVKRAS